MSNEIDWSKAPEGATHFIIDIDGHVEDSFAVEKDDRYQDVDSHSYLMKSDVVGGGWIVLARPPHWNGNGLPPVGSKVVLRERGFKVYEPFVEMLNKEVEVVAVFRSPVGYEMIACAQPDGLCGCFRAEMAEPIRTPEQIAAEKYERELDEIEQVILHAHYGLYDMGAPPSERARACARALHYFFKNKTEQEQDQ